VVEVGQHVVAAPVQGAAELGQFPQRVGNTSAQRVDDGGQPSLLRRDRLDRTLRVTGNVRQPAGVIVEGPNHVLHAILSFLTWPLWPSPAYLTRGELPRSVLVLCPVRNRS
jgi:hypothetical protein